MIEPNKLEVVTCDFFSDLNRIAKDNSDSEILEYIKDNLELIALLSKPIGQIDHE